MNKTIFYLSFILIFVACSQQTKKEVFINENLNAVVVKHKNDIDNITYLIGGAAIKSSGLSMANFGQPKHAYIDKFNTTGHYLQWEINVPKGGAGSYNISALLKAKTKQKFKIELSTSKLLATIAFAGMNDDWDKLDLGSLNLPEGISTIKLTVSSNGEAQFKSLELIKTSNVSDYLKRVDTFRSDVSWLAESKYGVMFQYGAWSYPKHGGKKSLEEQTNDFNVPNFVKMIKETGASYVLWSMTWWTYQISAPIETVDTILGHGNRTSTRDLIGEIATALDIEGINFMLYYHTGQDSHLGYNTTDWWKAQQWPEEYMNTGLGNREIFFNNWIKVVNEIGLRYGNLLDGWFFDDGLVYYPAPFEKMGAATKSGNPNRLVAYNDWVISRYTEFQDMTFGEGQHGQVGVGSSPFGGNGIYSAGKSKGLLQHEMFMMEQDWGVHEKDTDIKTKVTLDQTRSWLNSSIPRNVPLSFNMMMWEDGTVAKESLDIMKTLKTEFR